MLLGSWKLPVPRIVEWPDMDMRPLVSGFAG
jgi:hypothetical protein